MKLLELAKKNLDEYLYIPDFIDFISKSQQTPIKHVALFLLSQNLHRHVQTYRANNYFIIESIDEYNWGEFCETNNLLIEITNVDDSFYELPKNLIDNNLKNLYWKTSELFDIKIFESLNIDWYLYIKDIINIINYSDFNQIHDYQKITYFEERSVKNLLINHLTYGMADQKATIVNKFVESLFRYLQKDLNNSAQIFHTEIKKFFFKHKIIISGFNDNLDNEESHFNESSTNERVVIINDENYLKIIEEELIYIPKIEIEVFEEVDQNTGNDVIDLSLNEELNILTKSDYFDIFDSACLMSLDEPSKLNSDINYGDDWKYGEHKQAIKVLNYAIKAQEIDEDDGLIPRDSLQSFLFNRGTIIKGFNDGLKDCQSNYKYNKTDNENTVIDTLKQENKKLKAELLEKQQKLEELELTQTTQDESKLGNTRAENNVTKLLLVLAKMANIDINKPHAIHESLLVQAELLGVDRFPSDETIKKWLIKANRHGNDKNPN